MSEIGLVCGGRDYDNRSRLNFVLEEAREEFRELICGYDPESRRFQGADQLAYEWAKVRERPVRCFAAQWNTHGLSAGPRRNGLMAAERPRICIAFPRADGSWGRGTRNMIGQLAENTILWVIHAAQPLAVHRTPATSAWDRPISTLWRP